MARKSLSVTGRPSVCYRKTLSVTGRPLCLLQEDPLSVTGRPCLLQEDPVCYRKTLCLLQEDPVCYRKTLCLLQEDPLSVTGRPCLLQEDPVCYRKILSVTGRPSVCYRKILCLLQTLSVTDPVLECAIPSHPVLPFVLIPLSSFSFPGFPTITYLGLQVVRTITQSAQIVSLTFNASPLPWHQHPPDDDGTEDSTPEGDDKGSPDGNLVKVKHWKRQDTQLRRREIRKKALNMSAVWPWPSCFYNVSAVGRRSGYTRPRHILFR